MNSAIITGAAGFIGSHLAEALTESGWNVLGIDNFDPFYPREVKLQNLRKLSQSPLFRLVDADMRDFATLREVVSGNFDVIVHLAAKAGVRPSLEDPQGYQIANVLGTQNVLDLAKELHIKQFVFASSSSVYGVNPNVPWSEEDHVLQPISPYASTKVAGELLGHVYSHLHGIRFIALRFFTVYGPRQRPDLAIQKFASCMLSGDSIPVYGDGSTRRDYTYVGDIVNGICAAMTYDRSAYEIINLGNNHTVSLAELVLSLERALGVKAHLHKCPEQPGDVPQTWADISKAKALLGYQPRTDLLDGLRRFVDSLGIGSVSPAEPAIWRPHTRDVALLKTGDGDGRLSVRHP